MYEDILESIAKEKEKYGLLMQPPCSDLALVSLEKRVKEELKAELDGDYALFLKKTNGLDHNGLVMYASETMAIAGFDDRMLEGLVEANRDLRDVERFVNYLVYGTSGEVNYAYSFDDEKFVTLDAVSFDCFDSFSTFRELLVAALKENE
jgi:hypothetical protein